MEEINNLLEALQFSPENIPLKMHLAKIYVSKNMKEEAIVQYKEILKIDRTKYDAMFALADTYYNSGSYSTAIIILEELGELNGKTIKQLELLAKSHIKDNSINKAQDIYKKILKISPNYTNTELDDTLKVGNVSSNNEQVSDENNDSSHFLEKPTINFNDVGGMKLVKKEIELKIIKPLEHQELYKAYGKKIGGGILLYGPPGCGKTYLAKATAGQIDAKFINIGINDILDMWVGNSEKNLHDIFEVSRRNNPSVLFFDEIDALGAKRSDMRQSAGKNLINQFLSELDGVDSNNEGVLIIGATNTPWSLDSAFRRPGRFDRIIFVPPPDLEGRTEILKILLSKKPIKDIDYYAIASKTKEFSGADLKAIIDICIEEKLETAFETGIPEPITTKDLVKSAKKHKPSTKEWFNTARNYALYANDSGLYDDILDYLKIKR